MRFGVVGSGPDPACRFRRFPFQGRMNPRVVLRAFFQLCWRNVCRRLNESELGFTGPRLCPLSQRGFLGSQAPAMLSQPAEALAKPTRSRERLMPGSR